MQTTSARRLGTIALVLGLLLVPASSTSAFSGPWNASHMPATIANREVRVGAGTGEAYEVRIGSGVSCPEGKPLPPTVTFSDPSGSVSVTLSDPCAGTWTEPPTETATDFSLRTFAGIPSVSEPSITFVSATSTPFVYEVTSASGVIARGAVLATVIPPRVIDQRHRAGEYEALCVEGRQELRSLGHGDHYCEVGGGTNYTAGDWPAPPTTKKPKYPALTLATAPYWTEIAVEYHFGYRAAPQQFRASGCASSADGRYPCDVSWSDGAYSYAGLVKVGAANVYTGRYRYTLRVVRTDPQTHERRTFITG